VRTVPALLIVVGLAACAVLPGGSQRVEEPCELGEDVVGGQVEPGATDVVVPVRKKAWEAEFGGEEAARPHITQRLVGWPVLALADRRKLPADDREFVARLARDTWRGLMAFTDAESQLPIDNVRLAGRSVSPADARVGDYTNVSAIGLRLLATVAAYELELLTAPEAVDLLRATLATLRGLEAHEGFFFNYYDTTSLERTSNFVSFVDSSWLTAGLMVIRQTFPDLAAEATQLIDRQDYRFFYDQARRRMSHGYWVQRGTPSLFHYGMLYAESRLGSLIAIGKGDVPEEHWFAMVRTFPASCRWQTQAPRSRRRKELDEKGHTVTGGWYEWQGARYVPSWGGSMFEALMPTLVVDESQYAPASLGANDVVHVGVQRRFAFELLGYPVWGMSPSAVPGGTYGEHGIKVLGALGYEAGAVTPHASALALAVAPEAAIANLRKLAQFYDVYGDFGFYDAVEPRSGEVARAYLALDQAMTLVAAANYLKDHCIQTRFASDPIAQKALPILALEHFFD
jgi:hypothetical protein